VVEKYKDREFSDFFVGDYVSFKREFSLEDFKVFSKISGDMNPLHHDHAYAKATSFGDIIVPMHLVSAPLSAIAGMMIPGHRSLYLSTKIKSILPVFYRQEITYSAKIIAKQEAKESLVIRVLGFESNNIVLDAELLVQVRKGNNSYIQKNNPFDCVFGSEASSKKILITGASGAIGRAIAISMARKGHNLLLHFNNRNSEFDQMLVTCKAYGISVEVIKADLSKIKGVISFVKSIKKLSSKDKVSDIVHTASPPINCNLEDLMGVNFTALNYLVDNLIDAMILRQSGSITFIGSSALQFHPQGWENYIAAKVSATQYMSQIDKTYKNFGINARTVAPGVVLTDFSKEIRTTEENVLLPEQVGEIIANGICGEWSKDEQYIWIENNITRSGVFGFKEGISKSDIEIHSETVNKNTTSSLKNNKELSGLDELLIDFFNMQSDIDLSSTGINLYPGWDSLKHIELMVLIESRLGIKLESSDMEDTKNYVDLCKLIKNKKN
jgi:short-subunit dehydrogenase/acyl carrier protein/acyl dehydratase